MKLSGKTGLMGWSYNSFFLPSLQAHLRPHQMQTSDLQPLSYIPAGLSTRSGAWKVLSDARFENSAPVSGGFLKPELAGAFPTGTKILACAQPSTLTHTGNPRSP